VVEETWWCDGQVYFGERINVEAAVNDNPLPGKPVISNVADWAYVHFQLCMKYANAVLSEDAFVPGKK